MKLYLSCQMNLKVLKFCKKVHAYKTHIAQYNIIGVQVLFYSQSCLVGAANISSCLRCLQLSKLYQTALWFWSLSTMVKTWRSLHGGEFSPNAPKRQKNVYGVMMASSGRSSKRKSEHQESYKVLTGLLKETKQAIWYQILPLTTFEKCQRQHSEGNWHSMGLSSSPFV